MRIIRQNELIESKESAFSYSNLFNSAEIVSSGVLNDSKRSLAMASTDSVDILSVMREKGWHSNGL